MVETLSINHALKEGKTIVEVSVKDNNVEGALRILKKKMRREGIFKETN